MIVYVLVFNADAHDATTFIPDTAILTEVVAGGANPYCAVVVTVVVAADCP